MYTKKCFSFLKNGERCAAPAVIDFENKNYCKAHAKSLWESEKTRIKKLELAIAKFESIWIRDRFYIPSTPCYVAYDSVLDYPWKFGYVGNDTIVNHVFLKTEDELYLHLLDLTLDDFAFEICRIALNRMSKRVQNPSLYNPANLISAALIMGYYYIIQTSKGQWYFSVSDTKKDKSSEGWNISLPLSHVKAEETVARAIREWCGGYLIEQVEK